MAISYFDTIFTKSNTQFSSEVKCSIHLELLDDRDHAIETKTQDLFKRVTKDIPANVKKIYSGHGQYLESAYIKIVDNSVNVDIKCTAYTKIEACDDLGTKTDTFVNENAPFVFNKSFDDPRIAAVKVLVTGEQKITLLPSNEVRILPLKQPFLAFQDIKRV